jgi:hypothetical protein
MAVLTCPVIMREHRYGSNDPVMDTHEYRTFRWFCSLCNQRSLCTFATPEEAQRYLVNHLSGGYCKGAES